VFIIEGVREFHRWTHLNLTMVLDYLAKIPGSEYTTEVRGFGFPTLRQQVIHVLNCEGFWIRSLQGLSYVDREAAESGGVDDARLMQNEIRRQTVAYLSGLTDEQLNMEIRLKFPEGEKHVRTPAQVLHHIFTHAYRHEGQIAAMCRALGHPALDAHVMSIE
jgi:uncharacterized damage-inducible protein DinB